MRFFSIDGLVVKNNTQRVAGGDPGVVLTDDCGVHVSGNDFGRGGVSLGPKCAAPLRVPAVPALAGRGKPPTTTPPRPPGTRPTTPGLPHGPSSTRPVAPSEDGGGGATGWFVFAVVFGVVLAAAIAWVVRRRP
jgi:hypothetical protein